MTPRIVTSGSKLVRWNVTCQPPLVARPQLDVRTWNESSEYSKATPERSTRSVTPGSQGSVRTAARLCPAPARAVPGEPRWVTFALAGPAVAPSRAPARIATVATVDRERRRVMHAPQGIARAGRAPAPSPDALVPRRDSQAMSEQTGQRSGHVRETRGSGRCRRVRRSRGACRVQGREPW